MEITADEDEKYTQYAYASNTVDWIFKPAKETIYDEDNEKSKETLAAHKS